jgi:glutathione S-transferase
MAAFRLGEPQERPVYTLYSAPRSAALVVRVLLDVIGAAYKVFEVDINSDEARDPEFLRISPNGWVPALVYDGGAMYEAAAITIFLCDRHPQAALAPPPEDPLRGKFLQWLVYMAGTLEQASESLPTAPMTWMQRATPACSRST